MYNHNNNGKYLIHYGRKGMKWGQHIFTEDNGSLTIKPPYRKLNSKLPVRINIKNTRGTKKKIDDLVRSGKYEILDFGKGTGGRWLQFKNSIKDRKGRTLNIKNLITDIDGQTERGIDNAIRTLNDSRDSERRVSGLMQGLRDTYNRNDLTFDTNNIEQIYTYYDSDRGGPVIGMSIPLADGSGHYGSGTYYIQTGEFGKNDFAIDG